MVSRVPLDTGAIADVGPTTPDDAGEATDAGEPVDGESNAPDAGSGDPAKSDGGLIGDETTNTPTGTLEGGCTTSPGGGRSGLPGGLGLAALALVVRRRRRN